MEKENINISTQQVMTYIRQGVSGQTAVLPSIAEMPEAHQLTLDDRAHGILDFLKRPFDVLKANWSNEAAGTELVPSGISLPDVFFKNPMIAEKMRGFVGVRGKIRAKIMINAQKFQQGALLLYWIPNYDNISVKAKMIQKSLSGKSGNGHVVINCEGGTEQILDIPYVNQHIFYNMVTGQGNYGKLFLTPLLALNSPGNVPVGIRIQMWMEDPELQFATSAMPAIKVQSQSVSQMEEKAKHPADSEPLTKGGGLDVKAVWNAVSKSSMKPSYLSRTLANAMEIMGLSKPTQNASIHRVSLRTNSNMANYNGEYMGHKLALAADNELQSLVAPAGTSCDEMAISTLVKTPCYYKTFRVNCKNSPAGNGFDENYIVFSDLVHPQKFVPASNQPGGVYDSTFVGYVSSAFSQWSGGIKYNFTVAKTCFHSGTLRVSFIPGVYDAKTGVPNLETDPQFQLERCYQQTYDLRDLTEFSFVVPYTSTRPYLSVVNPFGTAATTIAKENWAMGVLVVDVFIPVVAPATTVSDFIEVAVWVSGADDLTLANPTAPPIYPYSPVTVASQSFSMNEATDRVEAIETSDTNINLSAPKTLFERSALCTGEVVASIKALCLRFGPFYLNSSLPAGSSLNVAPFHFQDPVSDLTQTKVFDYIDYFSYLFGFYRGGLRLCYDPGTASTSTVNTYRLIMRSALNNMYPSGTISRVEIQDGAYPSQFLSSPFSTDLVKPSIEGVIDFEVPYYNMTHITPALTANQTTKGVEESNYPLPVVSVIPRNAPSVTGNFDVAMFRSCSDDFRFHYMLGPPQVCLLKDTFSLNPLQFDPARYTTNSVKNDGLGNFAGLFGQVNFTVGTTSTSSPFRPPNQFLAVTPNNPRTIWLLPASIPYNFWSPGPSRTALNVNASYWTGGTNLTMMVTPPTFVFSLTATSVDLLVTMNTVAPAVATNPQAAPAPCMTVSASSCALTSTQITIPGQGIIVFGQPFTLTSRMLVFQVTDEATPTFLNATLINKGASVSFSLAPVQSAPTTGLLQVSDLNDNLIGYVAQATQANTNFPVNQTVFPLTAAEAYEPPAP